MSRQALLSIITLVLALCVALGHSKPALSAEADEAWLRAKEAAQEVGSFETRRVHVLRLQPGEDLLESIWRFARAKRTQALTVLTVVGSLTKTHLRYANDSFGTSREGHFEIVSAVGHIDPQDLLCEAEKGQGHVHVALADEAGNAFGGHLLRGNTVFTTAEVSLLELDGTFSRAFDAQSGYNELKIHPALTQSLTQAQALTQSQAQSNAQNTNRESSEVVATPSHSTENVKNIPEL